MYGTNKRFLRKINSTVHLEPQILNFNKIGTKKKSCDFLENLNYSEFFVNIIFVHYSWL